MTGEDTGENPTRANESKALTPQKCAYGRPSRPALLDSPWGLRMFQNKDPAAYSQIVPLRNFRPPFIPCQSRKVLLSDAGDAEPSPHVRVQPNPRSMSLPGSSNEQDTAPSRSDAPTAAQLPTPKQIRFVSHDGQPHAKRRRVNAACQTCRKRKTRCSGERPKCSTCTENGHTCGGYKDSAQARKASPNHSSDEAAEAVKDAVASKPANGGTSNGDGHVPVLEKVTSNDSTLSHENTLHRMNHGSPNSSHTTNSMASARNRVPYFRYFGPTAIVPGFKQMVVQMRDHRRSFNSTAESPGQCAASFNPGPRPNLHERVCNYRRYAMLFNTLMQSSSVSISSFSLTLRVARVRPLYRSIVTSCSILFPILIRQ